MTALRDLLAACQAMHKAVPELRSFAPWPTDLSPSDLPARHRPAADLIACADDPANAVTRPVADAIRRAAHDLHWRRLYTEAEVGPDMMARYAFVELFGPKGHFHSAEGRGFIGYWGHDLSYDWHAHEAEELYICISGHGQFKAQGVPDVTLSPGDVRGHSSRQPHAMDTGAGAFLGFVMWRGAGLFGVPEMSAA